MTAKGSLAEQLQRLAVPQTSIFVESKSRPSILYDTKEAANVDRQTIFDLARSGLEDLINSNPVFRQFENTLFNESTINFERAMETSSVNEILDKNIRKFLFQLSPYFSKATAHKCLEWLIRRYRINEYNINDMMALILPYHETSMFVKCLQTIPLTEISPWHWLIPIQKPGVALSKQALINRAASDSFFLKFISETTSEAVKQLHSKGHTLQALFAFYTSITLGALSAMKEITDLQASNIIMTLFNGLKSNVVDFCAAAMLITGFLLTKIDVADKCLRKIVERIVNIPHKALKRESMVLLIIICERQSENLDDIIEICLSKMIDNTQMATTLEDLHKCNVNILPLCLPLITKCLRNVENQSEARKYQKFIEHLLTELRFNNEDANAIIRCILNAVKPIVKPQSEVIDLNSDDEDGDVEMGHGRATQNHSNLMKILETKYPDVFDAVKTDIMTSEDEESSSLKIVLGYLLCSTYNADPSGVSIFVDLYHPSAKNRMQAIEVLVNKNKLTMPISDDKKNLLVVGIAQSLNDSCPNVVNEVLKFNTEDLAKIVGEANLIKKLKFIIGDQFMTEKQWQSPIRSAIKHITSKDLLSDSNEIEIFLAIWPYMFPVNDTMSSHKAVIVKSAIGNRFSIIKQLADIESMDNKNLMESVNRRLKNSFEKSKIQEIVEFMNIIPDGEMTKMLAFHVVNLLTNSLPMSCDHNLSNGVFDVVTKLTNQFGLTYVDTNAYVEDLYNGKQTQKLPTEILVKCMESIIDKTNFSAVFQSNIIDFTISSGELNLLLKLHAQLCNGLHTKSDKTNNLYHKAMSHYVRVILPKVDQQFDFFSNFFIGHYIDQLKVVVIDPSLQLRSIRYFNQMLKEMATVNEITMEVFIRIISGLTSPNDAVRVLTCDTIDQLHESLDKLSQFASIFGLLSNQREKISLNQNELSEFFFHTKHKRKQLFEFIGQPGTATILKASLLNMLQLVTDDTKYLNTAVDVALNILNKIDGSEQTLLNPHESVVVHRTILRLDSEKMASILSTVNCGAFFEKILQQSNVLVQTDNKQQSISVVAMKLNIFEKFQTFSTKHQKFVVEAIVKAGTFSLNQEVRSAARRLFQKFIEFDGKFEFDTLTKMAKVTSQHLLQTPEWKCGVTLLEFLQKKRFENPQRLMEQLFPILKNCLQFDDQSTVEYTKQLVLGDILNCCELMSGKYPKCDFKIDLVLQCLRLTENPQTHHHALQLLTKLTTMMPPDVILQSITEIFTFIGNLVAPRDDDYIYRQVANVIKSVVPILKQKNEIQVLKTFTDMLLDVPTHRRSALYADLLTILDPKKCLWMFLAILFEVEVRTPTNSSKSPAKKSHTPTKRTQPLAKRTQVAIEITNLFDCDVILKTCHELIKYLRAQLKAIDKHTEIDDNLKHIFNPKLYSNTQCVQHLNGILTFIHLLTVEKSRFSVKMASLERASLIEHKETFKNIIPAIIKYIKEYSRSSIENVDKSLSDGLGACFHILDNLLELLYPDMLLRVVNTLLSEENEVEVRRKLIDLLNKKLASPEMFVDCKDSILSLLEPLTNIVNTITETPSHASIQEEALMAIQFLSKIIAREHPNEFADVLKNLATILQSYENISIPLRALLIQCMGELCFHLRVHTVSHLHRFMPTITAVINDLLRRSTGAISLCFDIILKAIYRIVETVPQFLTPYLVDLIKSLSILWSRLQSSNSNESHKIVLRLDQIWQKLSSSLELRVLIPMVESHIYPGLLEQKMFNATGPLMMLLLDSFENTENAALSQNSQELTKFFIGVMEFRAKYHSACTTVDVQEEYFIKAFIGFILKLSEQSFRPLYRMFYEWTNDNADELLDRAVSFYRLSNKLAEKLKTLFIRFAPVVIENSAALLQRKFTKAEIAASSTKPVTLIYNILSTLQTVFLYDNNSFINTDRFNTLIDPLANLLDNDEYLLDGNVYEILPKCFAQLAVAVNNDLLWKQLNHQILIKTRSNSVAVRRCALLCSVEVMIKLGEDSTQLYPEAIPFFSELLEDDDVEIKKICHKSVLQIENVTGEDLKKHL